MRKKAKHGNLPNPLIGQIPFDMVVEISRGEMPIPRAGQQKKLSLERGILGKGILRIAGKAYALGELVKRNGGIQFRIIRILQGANSDEKAHDYLASAPRMV